MSFAGGVGGPAAQCLLPLLLLLGCSGTYLAGAQEATTEAASVTESDDDDSSTMTVVLVFVWLTVAIVLMIAVAVTVFSLLKRKGGVQKHGDDTDEDKASGQQHRTARDQGVYNLMSKARRYSIGDEDKWGVFRKGQHETAV